MNDKYKFEQFVEDLDNGYKILYEYVRDRYMLYKVNDNCYMQELVEQRSRNQVQEKALITFKAVKDMFPFMKEFEYKQEG
jgi:hypothetical protein